MPHIVIDGPMSLEDIWLAYQHLEVAEGPSRFKTEGCFLSNDKTELLIQALVVERGFVKKFYAKLHQHEEGVTIKLDPLTDPEKTDGVRRLLGLFAERLLAAEPEAHVARTNIQPFIHMEP